ncbi:hypothetical protein MTR67_052742, partial [Solanum verrucosum]
MGKILAHLNQIPKGGLPSDTLANLKNDVAKCMTIMTRRGTVMGNDVPNVENEVQAKRMPGYAKFMKELITKNKNMDFGMIEVSLDCSAIMMSNMVVKKDDPGAFTIPCTIGVFEFAKALCDFGASIDLIPFSIYQQLRLGDPKSTTMRLLMVDRSIKSPIGVLYDILVKVDKFIFPADLVILDYKIDIELSIILGRPFLATERTLVNVES